MQEQNNIHPSNIIIIGAGGIVKDAHLPAYKIAGYQVKGVFDLDKEKAKVLAEAFNITEVYNTLESSINAADEHSIFDVAVPGNAILSVLEKLPKQAVVLIQKPMGEDLEMAEQILDCCRAKQFVAGVNFQLRYAPFILKAKEMIKQGAIGELCDIEININVYTPWHLWSFLKDLPRVEILYHSIHYIDLIRSFFGNPAKLYAKSNKHPNSSQLASVRSNIIMDYGLMKSASILTNHNHNFGEKHQKSYIKLEGTHGAIRMSMGVLKSYPKGNEDLFEYVQLHEGNATDWENISVEGTWFPHAFIGSMNEMMQARINPNYMPDNSVEDCIDTMACVEAAYMSSKDGGVDVQQLKINFKK